MKKTAVHATLISKVEAETRLCPDFVLRLTDCDRIEGPLGDFDKHAIHKRATCLPANLQYQRMDSKHMLFRSDYKVSM